MTPTHGRRGVHAAIHRLARAMRRRMRVTLGIVPTEAPRRVGECGRLEWTARDASGRDGMTVRVWWNVPMAENLRGEPFRHTGGIVEVSIDDDRGRGRTAYACLPVRSGLRGAPMARALWPGLLADWREWQKTRHGVVLVVPASAVHYADDAGQWAAGQSCR